MLSLVSVLSGWRANAVRVHRLPSVDDADRVEFPKESERISRRIAVEIANCVHLTS